MRIHSRSILVILAGLGALIAICWPYVIADDTDALAKIRATYEEDRKIRQNTERSEGASSGTARKFEEVALSGRERDPLHAMVREKNQEIDKLSAALVAAKCEIIDREFDVSMAAVEIGRMNMRRKSAEIRVACISIVILILALFVWRKQSRAAE